MNHRLNSWEPRYLEVYPFAHGVHIDAVTEPFLVLRCMPTPANLTVHLANEHGRGSGDKHWSDNQHTHLLMHAYGKFREGAEHFHAEKVRLQILFANFHAMLSWVNPGIFRITVGRKYQASLMTRTSRPVCDRMRDLVRFFRGGYLWPCVFVRIVACFAT